MLAASSLSRCLSCSPECRLGGNIPSASSVCAALFKHNCFITTLFLQSLISPRQFHLSVWRLSALLECPAPARSHQPEEITTLPVLKWDPGRRTLLHGEKRPQARVPGPIPGPLPAALRSLPIWPQHTEGSSLGRNRKQQPAGPPGSALVPSNRTSHGAGAQS